VLPEVNTIESALKTVYFLIVNRGRI